jgi:hypothetical protein
MVTDRGLDPPEYFGYPTPEPDDGCGEHPDFPEYARQAKEAVKL